MLFIGLAFVGLVVISVCAVRVAVAVRGLGRELRRTKERLEPKRSALIVASRRLERSQE